MKRCFELHTVHLQKELEVWRPHSLRLESESRDSYMEIRQEHFDKETLEVISSHQEFPFPLVLISKFH